MRLTKNPRTLAAISFIGPVVLALALLAILWGTPGPTPLNLSLELSGVVSLSGVLAAALFSAVALSRLQKLVMLVICAAAAFASAFFSPVLLLGWVYPVWFLVRCYRESTV